MVKGLRVQVKLTRRTLGDKTLKARFGVGVGEVATPLFEFVATEKSYYCLRKGCTWMHWRVFDCISGFEDVVREYSNNCHFYERKKTNKRFSPQG